MTPASLIERFNGWLAKFVGPNAAHVIDGLIGVALTLAGAFAFSTPARTFASHHADLGLIILLAPPVLTALASKFRKAAGSQVSLVDEIVAAIEAAKKPDATDASPSS